MTRTEEAAPRTANEVTLVGRVTSVPEGRELPSGDVIVTFRVVVPRGRSPMARKSRQASDWIDCVAWGSRARRTVGRWRPGDLVEIEGSLRRRFYRAEARPSSRVEVEVLGGRLVSRG